MTDAEIPEADDAELRRRWSKKSPQVSVAPPEAIEGRVRDATAAAIDRRIVDEFRRMRGED